MKVLYLMNYYQEPGGENLWSGSEASLMRGHGHETVHYNRSNDEIRAFGPLRRASLVWRTTWAHDSWRAIRALIRAERPDIVHSFNQHIMISPSAYYACRAESVPVVQTIYNYRLVCPGATLYRNGAVCTDCMDSTLASSVIHGCFRNSRAQTAVLAAGLQIHRILGTWRNIVTGYIVPSRFMGNQLRGLGISAAKIYFKPNYHEPDPGARSVAGESALYIGRLTRDKGVHTLLTAWREHSGLPRLIIAGSGPLEAECRALAAERPDAVRFLGQVPHERVLELTKNALCLIVPSEWLEGFPHVLLEALGCGVPIVASNIGTLAEVVGHGRNGLLFEPASSRSLSQAIIRMACDRELAETAGRRARGEYLEKYTAERNYEMLIEIYQVVRDRYRSGVSQTEPAARTSNAATGALV